MVPFHYGSVVIIAIIVVAHGAPEVLNTSFALSATLGDHMVLQREPASALVWGFAPAGTEVTTTFRSVEYTSKAGSDSVWRVHLEATPAGGPYTITFAASSGEEAALVDVLFGDVYICGGQSNMQFSVGGNENAGAYAKEADSYPNIRLFTVGTKTKSNKPLKDLRTIEQKWGRASDLSVSHGSPFKHFSAVCWFFGRDVFKGLDSKVPVGLISDNWGGTQVEQWMPPATSLPCGHASTGELYNAMVVPYTVGPMAVTGFIWYQGESDLGGNSSLPMQNRNYTCTQTAMMEEWRHAFQVPHAFYAVVVLSTWCPATADDNLLLAELRDEQVASGDLIPNFAYATNADYGAGCNIHPPYKQHCGARLANAALSLVYSQPINWRSPTYESAYVTGIGVLAIWLNDVTDAGLALKVPANAKTAGDCAVLNAKKKNTCAWAGLQFNDAAMTWVNATVEIGPLKKSMVLRALPPTGATTIIASSYGWGAIPMLSVYRADMANADGQLPVLPWNRKISSGDWKDAALIV